MVLFPISIRWSVAIDNRSDVVSFFLLGLSVRVVFSVCISGHHIGLCCFYSRLLYGISSIMVEYIFFGFIGFDAQNHSDEQRFD